METNGNWNEYSKLVFRELETLGKGIEKIHADMKDLRKEISEVQRDLKKEISEVQRYSGEISVLQNWKTKMDEITTPASLKEDLQKIEELNSFKIKAITIFATVQFAMALALFIMQLIG